tara:strand:+ start:453 stop:821 length:369 start_codon:yes stop_codon:yes gene_type:complete
MALPPTTNAGTKYFNRNQCRSFEQEITNSALTKLSGASPTGGQLCSEVLIINKSGQTLHLYDRAELYTNGIPEDEYRLTISNNDTVTLRGLTNVDQVSAKTAASSGFITYRTQYFSSNPITS